MKFTRMKADTLDTIQLGAGLLAKNFDTETGELQDSDILGATTGGINFTATPSFTDYGEDIDNCPKNTMELKRLEDWEVLLSGTFVTVNAEVAQMLAALADIQREKKIVPRRDLKQTDFRDIWLVSDYGDKDGFVAIKLLNALSTGGFQIQTTDRAKGQFAFEFMGHYSIAATDKVPFEIYIEANREE